MNDFVSGFWGPYIATVVLGGIFWLTWLLISQSKGKVTRKPDGTVDDTGHEWDGDLRELNNPLPRWWFWMFLLTVIFALFYLALYPGLGMTQGSLGFTSPKEHDADRAQIEAKARQALGPYMAMEIQKIAVDPKAREIGQRLFLNNCAQCHGSDAGGSKGFPNLADNDWLYGGEPDNIRATILNGRNGVMPPFGEALGSAKVVETANYVRSLSGLSADPIKVAAGQEHFKANCAACHGPDGKGNQAIGAPNLTDKTWLYGSAEATIIETITKGRNNRMPAHESLLTPEKVQMLVAYVWGLSNASTQVASK